MPMRVARPALRNATFALVVLLLLTSRGSLNLSPVSRAGRAPSLLPCPVGACHLSGKVAVPARTGSSRQCAGQAGRRGACSGVLRAGRPAARHRGGHRGRPRRLRDRQPRLPEGPAGDGGGGPGRHPQQGGGDHGGGNRLDRIPRGSARGVGRSARSGCTSRPSTSESRPRLR